MENPTEAEVIIDTREKKWEEFTPTLDRMGVSYSRKTLIAGDLGIKTACGDMNIGFERKTMADMLQSIADGRFLSQPPRIATLFKRPVFAVVGDVSFECPKCKYRTLDELEKMGIEYNSNVFYGGLASLFVRYGIEIMWLRDDVQLMNIVGRICKKVQEGKTGIPLRGVKAGYYRSPEAIRIHFLSGLSGVSPKIARLLVEHFKTLRNLFLVLLLKPKEEAIAELMKIKGIAEETASRIWRLINE